MVDTTAVRANGQTQILSSLLGPLPITQRQTRLHSPEITTGTSGNWRYTRLSRKGIIPSPHFFPLGNTDVIGYLSPSCHHHVSTLHTVFLFLYMDSSLIFLFTFPSRISLACSISSVYKLVLASVIPPRCYDTSFSFMCCITAPFLAY